MWYVKKELETVRAMDKTYPKTMVRDGRTDEK